MRTRTAVAGSGIEALATQFVMRLESRVTAPLRAKALPSRMAEPVVMVMLVKARICPSNAVSVPSVAELPTCQSTLHSAAGPPLITTTDELLAVVSVLPI